MASDLPSGNGPVTPEYEPGPAGSPKRDREDEAEPEMEISQEVQEVHEEEVKDHEAGLDVEM